VGTLAKLLLAFALIGTVAYDGLSIASAQVGVRDDAQAAALAGHDAYANSGSAQAAYAAVLKYADEHGDVVVRQGFSTGPHHTVTVELQRTARTVVAHYVPKVKSYVVADAVSRATDPVH
jgi:hypothetical protein